MTQNNAMPCRAVSLALALALSLPGATAQGQMPPPACNEDAMLVFDASGSMAEMGYNGLDFPRIVEAREALREALPQVELYRRIGLVIYGPGPRDACSNVDLRLTPVAAAAARIVDAVERVLPDGETPMTDAVRDAARVLTEASGRGTVVLVTDGRETCGGEPCQLAAELAAENGIVVHVIGFRVRSARFSWDTTADSGKTVARCLADRTGGIYVNAESTEELVQALRETLGCPVVGMAPALPRDVSAGPRRTPHALESG